MINELSTDHAAGIDITAVAKLKHADLWKAAKKLGGQSALARHLELNASEVGRWINMKSVPPSRPNGLKWTEEFWFEVEGKLFVLTGKTFEELFPEALRSDSFLKRSKTIERTSSMEAIALEHYALGTQRRLMNIDDYGEKTPERTAAIDRAIESLGDREAEIIRMRFGFNGEPSTLEEISKKLKVSQSRIGQLEFRAIRKLRDPGVLDHIKNSTEIGE